MRASLTRRGFTVVELIVVILAIVFLVGVLLPTLGGRGRGSSPLIRDRIQVRGTVQAMIIWAQNNQGSYPLPSKVDADDRTLPAAAWGPQNKDTTGNILSLLIFNGNISPELCVSPAESNTNVTVKMNYVFTAPVTAPDALWDPNFRGTPDDPVSPSASFPTQTTDTRSHNSYAHIPPAGARLTQWRDNFNANEAVFGNRGPQYAVDDAAPSPSSKRWSLLKGPTGTQSNTLRIHGGRTTWEGNIGYSDGSVRFETRATPESVGYARVGDPPDVKTPDNLFVNESDEVEGDREPGEVGRGRNAYLRPISAFTSPTRPRVWID